MINLYIRNYYRGFQKFIRTILDRQNNCLSSYEAIDKIVIKLYNYFYKRNTKEKEFCYEKRTNEKYYFSLFNTGKFM